MHSTCATIVDETEKHNSGREHGTSTCNKLTPKFKYSKRFILETKASVFFVELCFVFGLYQIYFIFFQFLSSATGNKSDEENKAKVQVK